MKDIFSEVAEQDFNTDGITYGWIQWKGTEVCIDLHCDCGFLGHFDGEFFYYYECPNCKKKYAVGQNIKLIALTEKQIQENLDIDFKTCEID